jgi:AcrR family transcriptional regulator
MALQSTISGPYRPRLRQDEKSAETRRRLLDAAIDCLIHRGYANTTSSEIAERAGLSRGAQLYHFPTKEDLLTRAIEHLFDLMLADLTEKVTGTQGVEDRRTAAIDLLWTIARGPLYRAWTELVLASRTDAFLHSSIREVNIRFNKYAEETFPEIFGVNAQRDELKMTPFVVIYMLEGMALEGDTLDQETADRIIESVKYLLARTIPPSATSNG